MTEIWVPYGPVEVSFDVKQENLSQILEPQSARLGEEELEKKVIETVGADSLLILSGSSGTQKILDAVLQKNKGITRILFPKQLGALARRKATEFQVANIEQLDTALLDDAGIVDGAPAKIPRQIKESQNLAVVTSIRYDPLFGLTSSASDLASLVAESKAEAFKRSAADLPCTMKSNASWYVTRLLQSCPNVSVIEIVEKASTGVLSFFSGEPEAAHAKAIDFWTKSLSVSLPARSERIVFGAGGGMSDATLNNALARSFFNIVSGAALKDSAS